jgi:hypothetical protein
MNPEPVLAQERTVQLRVGQDAHDHDVRRLTALLDRLLGEALSAIEAELRRTATGDFEVSLTLSSR